MNATRPVISESAWTHWYRRALPAYWIFLFCATHLPALRLETPGGDKSVHLVAFGLLAFLFWRFAEALGGPLSRRFVWIAGFWLVAYAAFDEYLQQFVGRGTELLDWLCDAAGIVLVLALLEWRRRKAASRREQSVAKVP